jgi:hypothetical protein
MNSKENEVRFAATKPMNASTELLDNQGSDLSPHKYNTECWERNGTYLQFGTWLLHVIGIHK